MLNINNNELLRQKYRPNIVDILFIGESCPQNGTFFYAANSNLYKYTAEAFENVFKKQFSLLAFQELNYWLYDICEEPINGLPDSERKLRIKNNISRLIETINILNPKLIIVIKKGFVRDIAIPKIINLGFSENTNLFNLPFPACGQQRNYVTQLTSILKCIDL